MSRRPVVLLVDSDLKHARLVSDALATLALPRPIHVGSGEAAVLWAGRHECDLCVLEIDLPGIDGLETLIRIRQRKPHIAAIMTSRARSEDRAVAAFRAGVLDYVPKSGDFPQVVAQLVQRFAQSQAQAHDLAPPLPPVEHLDRLVLPTYQNRLRMIGRHLDLHGYHTLNLSEVAGGFVVRALPPEGRAAEGLDFPDSAFLKHVADALAARGEGERLRSPSALLPTGYEDFLRAIGYRLDRRAAEAITITELGSFVAVGGVAPVDAFTHGTAEPFQDLLRQDDIAALLDEAFSRRGR